MKSNLRLFLELAAAAWLLSACRIVVDTTVNPDGSGELRTAVVYTAEEQENFAKTPGNESKSICDNLKQDAPAGAAFTEEAHGEEAYCVTTRRFANLRELRQFYAAMNNVTVNELQFELGRLTFDVDVDLTEADEGEGIANEWRLTLPGALGQHNADQIEGQTLIWVVSPGQKASLHAESSVGLGLTTLGPVGAVILACVCGLGAAGGAGMLWLLRWRRKGDTSGA